MRQDDGVEEDDFTGHMNIAAEDGDGGVELAAGVEECVVIHLGEWFVRVGIIRSALHPGPVTHR